MMREDSEHCTCLPVYLCVCLFSNLSHRQPSFAQVPSFLPLIVHLRTPVDLSVSNHFPLFHSPTHMYNLFLVIYLSAHVYILYYLFLFIYLLSVLHLFFFFFLFCFVFCVLSVYFSYYLYLFIYPFSYLSSVCLSIHSFLRFQSIYIIHICLLWHYIYLPIYYLYMHRSV